MVHFGHGNFIFLSVVWYGMCEHVGFGVGFGVKCCWHGVQLYKVFAVCLESFVLFCFVFLLVITYIRFLLYCLVPS